MESSSSREGEEGAEEDRKAGWSGPRPSRRRRRNEKKTAKLEAAKLFVYNVDKVSQYYLMKISPVRFLN